MFESYISSHGASRNPIPPVPGFYRPTQVFLSRRHFERGIADLLKLDSGSCAVLHVAVEGDDAGTGSVCRHMLNLVANTLRVCMRGGAAAYLGDAEFAVLLQGTDARNTEVYARTVISIVDGFHVTWEGETLSARAHIGGVLAGMSQDGAALLAQAMEAGKKARLKPLSRLHLQHSPAQEFHVVTGPAWDFSLDEFSAVSETG